MDVFSVTVKHSDNKNMAFQNTQHGGITRNTTGVRILANYKNGGSVVTSYMKKTAEETDNLDAVKPLARQRGWVITLNQRDNTEGVKSADALINGERWEIKTNYTPTKNAIDMALKGAKGQSSKIILNIKSDIDNDILVNQVEQRMKRSSWIEQVIVIRDNIIWDFCRKDKK